MMTETADGDPTGLVKIDYLTLSAGLEHDGVVPIPDDYEDEKLIEWRVGPMCYAGVSRSYPCGTFQHLREREHGRLLYRISGALCEKILPTIPLEFFRLTRLDLCVDVGVNIPLREYYQKQLDHHRGSSSLIQDQTLYIGSRKSDRFWRIYNKAVEQGLPGPLFRIECELKGARAKQARSSLMMGDREGLFRASAIGVVPEVLDEFWKARTGELPDLALPRKPRAGKRFLEKVVAPFLRENPWAVRWLRENRIVEQEDYE